jgi:hypothetical protein
MSIATYEISIILGPISGSGVLVEINRSLTMNSRYTAGPIAAPVLKPISVELA